MNKVGISDSARNRIDIPNAGGDLVLQSGNIVINNLTFLELRIKSSQEKQERGYPLLPVNHFDLRLRS